MWVRLILSLSGGLLASLGLFYLMANLIKVSTKELGKSSEQVSIDFVRTKRTSETESRRRQLPKKPPPPKKAPPVPKTQIAQTQEDLSTPEALNLEMPNMDLGLAGGSGPYLSRGGGGSGNGEETPLVRINPEYPIKARLKGIEGSVKLSFNISRAGTPFDVEVIEANPPRVFNRAARRAVMRWKYRPRMVDGKAVDSPDRLMVVLDFRLNSEEE